MRFVILMMFLVGTAHAGELDLGLGVQATTTTWPDDHGGGAALDASWWFRKWIGASFIAKEQYATVDDRFLSYFSVRSTSMRRCSRTPIAARA
jgi:hypothetical protein